MLLGKVRKQKSAAPMFRSAPVAASPASPGGGQYLSGGGQYLSHHSSASLCCATGTSESSLPRSSVRLRRLTATWRRDSHCHGGKLQTFKIQLSLCAYCGQERGGLRVVRTIAPHMQWQLEQQLMILIYFIFCLSLFTSKHTVVPFPEIKIRQKQLFTTIPGNDRMTKGLLSMASSLLCPSSISKTSL